MSKKLYVGNLSYSVTAEDLRALFEKYGNVDSAKVITDAATGRSRGFGFVEMPSDEEADKAVNATNGMMFMERALNVSEARPQAARGDRGGAGAGRPRRPGGGGFGGGRGKGPDSRWK